MTSAARGVTTVAVPLSADVNAQELKLDARRHLLRFVNGSRSSTK
jgi:hypothetical protein